MKTLTRIRRATSWKEAAGLLNVRVRSANEHEAAWRASLQWESSYSRATQLDLEGPRLLEAALDAAVGVGRTINALRETALGGGWEVRRQRYCTAVEAYRLPESAPLGVRESIWDAVRGALELDLADPEGAETRGPQATALLGGLPEAEVEAALSQALEIGSSLDRTVRVEATAQSVELGRLLAFRHVWRLVFGSLERRRGKQGMQIAALLLSPVLPGRRAAGLFLAHVGLTHVDAQSPNPLLRCERARTLANEVKNARKALAEVAASVDCRLHPLHLANVAEWIAHQESVGSRAVAHRWREAEAPPSATGFAAGGG